METNNRATTAAINSLLRRGDEALAAEDWEGAAEYYQRALEADEDNPSIMLSLFLANHHLLDVDELRGVAAQIVNETPAQRSDLADVLVNEARDGRRVDASVAGLLNLQLPSPDVDAGEATEESAADKSESAVEASSASTNPQDKADETTDSAEEASRGASGKGAIPTDEREAEEPVPSTAGFSIHASYPQRIQNLKLSRDAFEGTFEDEYWQLAYERGGLEQRRHMERARADADAVFDAAFAEEQKLLASMCARAKVRIPRVKRITASALASCDDALSNFATSSGERKEEVSNEYAFLGNNLRTAHACLWVGAALVVVGAVLLALAIIPRGASVQNNTFAAFPEYFVPLGIVVVLVGVVLLGLRVLLVRSNRETMSERQASAGAAKVSLVQDSDLLNTKVAAVRSRCHSLEALPLDASDEEFEQACSDLDATVKALGK